MFYFRQGGGYITLSLLVKVETRILNGPIESSPEAAIGKFNAKKEMFAYAYKASVPGKHWQCIALCCCFVLQCVVALCCTS